MPRSVLRLRVTKLLPTAICSQAGYLVWEALEVIVGANTTVMYLSDSLLRRSHQGQGDAKESNMAASRSSGRAWMKKLLETKTNTKHDLRTLASSSKTPCRATCRRCTVGGQP
eukprot:scpid7609/ scgid30641/ 